MTAFEPELRKAQNPSPRSTGRPWSRALPADLAYPSPGGDRKRFLTLSQHLTGVRGAFSSPCAWLLEV